MAYTTADREALERALAKGERRVTFGDKTVEYRSVDEWGARCPWTCSPPGRVCGRRIGC